MISRLLYFSLLFNFLSVSICWADSMEFKSVHFLFCYGYMPSDFYDSHTHSVYRKHSVWISYQSSLLATFFFFGWHFFLLPLNQTLEMYLDWDYFHEALTDASIVQIQMNSHKHTYTSSNHNKRMHDEFCFCCFPSILLAESSDTKNSIVLCYNREFVPSIAISPFNYDRLLLLLLLVHTCVYHEKRLLAFSFQKKKLTMCVCGNLMLN